MNYFHIFLTEMVFQISWDRFGHVFIHEIEQKSSNISLLSQSNCERGIIIQDVRFFRERKKHECEAFWEINSEISTS